MSIIQTTATIGSDARYPADYVGGHKRRPPITPREVRPARWQLSGLLICGVLFSALGAILLALGMDANRSAAPVACGLLMMVAAAVGLRQGRRTALTLDGRACQIATADGEVWIPWAEMAGARVEHTWRGSHAVLEVDGVPAVRLSAAQLRREPHRLRNLMEGQRCAAVHDAYERTDAPLWEARRTLRRMLGATALVIAIAVALAPLGPWAGLCALPWLVWPLAIALPPGLRAICLGDGHEFDETLRRDVPCRDAAVRAWAMFAGLLAFWIPLTLAVCNVAAA
jgi:hypothetical protein